MDGKARPRSGVEKAAAFPFPTGTPSTLVLHNQDFQVIPYLQKGLTLNKARYSSVENTNDVSFVGFSKEAKIFIPFGTLKNSEDVSNAWSKVESWRQDFGEYAYNYTKGLEFVDQQVFNFTSHRPKMIVVVGDLSLQ